MLAFGLGLALGSNPILRMEATRVYHLAIDSPARPEYLEPTVDAFSLAAMKAISLRTAYRFRESAVACREVARTVEDMPPALLAQFGDHVGTILRQLSYSMLQGGMYEDALANIGRSVALCQTQRARNYSIVYAAAAHAFTGNIARAKAVLASIDTDAWPVELRRTYMNAPGLIAETYAQVDAMDFEGAVKIQTAEFWPFLATLSVTARQGRGQAHAAAQQVTRELTGAVPPPGTGDNVATASLHGAVARAWIAAGDLRAAGRLLDSQRADSVYTAAARIELLLSAERDREALALSDELLAAADHTLRTRAETLTVAAVAALRRAETERAWDWLSEAAVTWETYGPRHHVAMLTTTDRRSLLDLSLDRDSSLLRRYLELPAGRSVRQPAVVLTPRERIVLAAFARHDSVREVAAALVVSPHTVKTQLQGVYRKLGVSSRRAALTVAHELGLLEDT
jgi:LuxR family maltose regulon positive regulatory protein